MRITIVCPAFDMCGGQRVVALYGSRLRAKGHEVVVVGLPPRPHSLRERLRALRRGDRIRWREPMGPSHFDPYPGLARRIDRFRPITARDVPDADVVVATWWETAEWAADLPPEKGAKVYFIQHHETFPYLPIDRVEATLTRTDFHKIAVAPWLVDLLRDRYGDPNAKLVLNGVDVNHFRAPARAKNAIPTVGLMYTETSFKGTEIALKAYDLASRRVPGRGWPPSARGGRAPAPTSPPGWISRCCRRRIRYLGSTPGATPGCSRAGARASGCRSSNPWPAGLPSSAPPPAQPPR
jgi:glycosyltransferase involved in cell wall biosynthesis